MGSQDWWRDLTTSNPHQILGTQASQWLLHIEGSNSIRELIVAWESTATTNACPELDLNVSTTSKSVLMAIVSLQRGDGPRPQQGFQFGMEYKSEDSRYSTRTSLRGRLHSHTELVVYSRWLMGQGIRNDLPNSPLQPRFLNRLQKRELSIEASNRQRAARILQKKITPNEAGSERTFFPPSHRTIMKVTTISQNVQGLNDESFSDLLRNYYRNHLHNLEVLCFQEHKLRGIKLAVLGGKVWRDANFFGEEANVAYNNIADGIGIGSGGICIWISPYIQHMICETGYIQSGRAQWVRLSDLPGGDMTLLNVYAPNSPPKRCKP